MKKNIVLTALITLPLFFSSFANAGGWEEREYLKRYVIQLEALNKNLLMDAKRSADLDSRIQLNYDALMKDADEIINKVNHHLYTPLSPFKRSVDNVNDENS